MKKSFLIVKIWEDSLQVCKYDEGEYIGKVSH